MANFVIITLILLFVWGFIAAMLTENVPGYSELLSQYERGKITKDDFVRKVFTFYGLVFWPFALIPWILYQLYSLLCRMVSLAAWALSDDTDVPKV